MNSNPDKLKVIHSNPAGYIARCTCCREVQIGIGNIATHMDIENFQGFYRALQAANQSPDKKYTMTPMGEKFLMNTPVNNLYLVFTPKEFQQTLDLFAQAWVVLEASERIHREA